MICTGRAISGAGPNAIPDKDKGEGLSDEDINSLADTLVVIDVDAGVKILNKLPDIKAILKDVGGLLK